MLRLAHNYDEAKIGQVHILRNEFGIEEDVLVRSQLLAKKETNKNQIPFEADVIIDATFSFENWEGPMKPSAIGNSTAILFPYLRSVLSAVTLNGNIAPYTLPVMNINRLFAQSDDTKTND